MTQTAALTSYCQRRLTDDPHLPPAALLQELASLGYRSTRQEVNETLRQHNLRTPCQHCASVPPLPTVWTAPLTPAAQPLPIRVSPLGGQLLASYLTRVAAANHLSTGDLAASLPGWLNRRIWNHNHTRHHPHGPAATSALHQLAAISGTPARALARSLPVFGGGPAGPARAAIACRRCAAARGVHRLVPVHLPAWQQICTRHGIWLASPSQPQLDITTCPAIITAQHHAHRLLRCHTPQQLLLALATVSNSHAGTTPAKQQLEYRIRLLMTANPRMNDPPAQREITQAAAYPDTIALTASTLTHAQPDPPTASQHSSKQPQTGQPQQRAKLTEIEQDHLRPDTVRADAREA
jgi:hypothetical protein